MQKVQSQPVRLACPRAPCHPDILPEGHGRDALDFSAPLSASLTEVGQNGFIFWGCFPGYHTCRLCPFLRCFDVHRLICSLARTVQVQLRRCKPLLLPSTSRRCRRNFCLKAMAMMHWVTMPCIFLNCLRTQEIVVLFSLNFPSSQPTRRSLWTRSRSITRRKSLTFAWTM